MSVIYLESSVVLAWLLGESKAAKIDSLINTTENILTSQLTLLETKRTFVRLEAAARLSVADREKAVTLLDQAASIWNLMEINQEVQSKAANRFPREPVRSLDAIHLATALTFLKIFPDLQFASLDERILINLEPLGLFATKI